MTSQVIPSTALRETRTAAAEHAPARWPSRIVRLLVAILFIWAIWTFAWPVYRAFFNIEIDANEGWNAYYAEAAMGRMPLYPGPDQLITNNYPPLSFFIVGGLGHLIGDPLLAGRLISLLAVAGITVAVALCVRRLGGSRLGAWLGASVFLVTICRFSDRYVGMNDPQLLGQAVMTFGFAGFLGALRRDRGYGPPILVMALAGFIKHNIITLPGTAFLWLIVHRPRQAVKWFGLAVLVLALGFGLCAAVFGKNFVFNMTSPRQFSWLAAWNSIGRLKCLDIAAYATVVIAALKWRDRGELGASLRLCVVAIAIGFAIYVLQKTGAGVDQNALFDLLIASSIGVGVAFSALGSLHWPRRLRPELLQGALLVVLLIRAFPEKRYARLECIRMFFDPSLQQEIAIREQAMAESVARVRATPGDVITSTFVSYRAGKPYAYDRFNTDQRIACGKLSEEAIVRRKSSLTKVDSDHRADWDFPLNGAR